MAPDETFPALAALLSPFSVEKFLADYWERGPLYIPRGPETQQLFSLSEFDEVVTTGAHRHPEFSLVDSAKAVEVEDYAGAAGSIDAQRAIKRFGEGASIVLNRLDDWSPRVRALCARLEAELGMLVQANVYLTPSGAQGFAVHYDSHDVVIVQCEGRKKWKLFDSPVGLPMAGERFERERTQPGELTSALETGPGDALYIPRGLMHEALAVDGEASLHVTVGFHAVRWSEVLVAAFAEASLSDPGLRRGLPPGALLDEGATSSLDAAFSAHLKRVVGAMHWPVVRERLIERFLVEHKESLGGMLQGVASAPSQGAVFVARAGVMASVDLDGERAVLRVNGRETRWPAHCEGTLRRALELGRFSLDDLGEEIDLAGRLTLCRRLVAEGAVGVVQGSDREA